MMTSRAEHRLFLRQDNADLRLTGIGAAAGLATPERLERMERKRRETESTLRRLRTTRFAPGPALNAFLQENGEPEPSGSLTGEELLRRPAISFEKLKAMDSALNEVSPDAAEQAEIATKYAGYLEKQELLIRKARRLEETRLSPDIPYEQIDGLRIEARQKLVRQKPVSLGAAGRIPGVNPADVAVLSVWLEKQRLLEKKNG